MRETASAPVARPGLMRSHTTSRKVRHPSDSQPVPPSIRGETKRAPSSARANDNHSGFMGSVFSSPKPARVERQ